jgi:hypothetical protein
MECKQNEKLIELPELKRFYCLWWGAKNWLTAILHANNKQKMFTIFSQIRVTKQTKY